jgi:xanthine dehydrogenase molybdopterin-binding subunit B
MTSLSLVAALSLHAACGGAWLTREALENAESRWRAHSIESYAIEESVSESDKTLRRVRLEVRDGEIVEATMVENGTERRIDGDAAGAYTVDGLFRTLDEELAAGKRRYVRASFDSARGFPERIELGPLRGAPVATIWVIRVESFRVAPPAIR